MKKLITATIATTILSGCAQMGGSGYHCFSPGAAIVYGLTERCVTKEEADAITDRAARKEYERQKARQDRMKSLDNRLNTVLSEIRALFAEAHNKRVEEVMNSNRPDKEKEVLLLEILHELRQPKTEIYQ